MAQLYTSGALHLFIGGSQQSTPSYLGTGERGPRQRIRRGWSPVFNDIGGEGVAFDYMFQGQEGWVTAELTRWNQTVLDSIQDAARPFGAGGTIPGGGVDLAGDVGTLMVSEGVAYNLYVLYDYGAAGRAPHPAMVLAPGGAMPPGRRWLAAFLESPDEEEKGTTPNKVVLTWHCLRVYNQATGALSLFDRNMGALAGAVIN